MAAANDPYIASTTATITQTPTTKELVGSNTPDGLVVNATKISFYASSTPVAQAAAITAIDGSSTMTQAAVAVNALIVACGASSGIGITL
jgi:hypothetical protein